MSEASDTKDACAAAHVPLPAEHAFVIDTSRAHRVGDREHIRVELEMGHALGHVRAAVHVIYTVAEVVAPRKHRGARGTANCATAMKVLHQHSAVLLGPSVDIWR